MYLFRWRSGGAMVLLLSGVCATSARADVFRAAPFALGQAGFNLEGSRNPLSGGADFSISRNLAGAPLDSGDLVLTLQEPVTLDLSLEGHPLSGLDISLDTILDVGSSDTVISVPLRNDTLFKLIAPLPSDGRPGNPTLPLGVVGIPGLGASNPPGAVPEPIVLLLMLLGVPAVLLRRRRQRTRGIRSMVLAGHPAET